CGSSRSATAPARFEPGCLHLVRAASTASTARAVRPRLRRHTRRSPKEASQSVSPCCHHESCVDRADSREQRALEPPFFLRPSFLRLGGFRQYSFSSHRQGPNVQKPTSCSTLHAAHNDFLTGEQKIKSDQGITVGAGLQIRGPNAA